MSKPAHRRFGAFLDQDRVYVIEYRRSATGIEIVDHMSVTRHMEEIADATDAVIELVESVTARGKARLTATIRGFGISYSLLTLPPAGADVLAPIVDREMQRLFPDIADPLVAFVLGGHLDRRTGGPHSASRGLPERRAISTAEVLPLEILAAISPRRVVDTIADGFQSAGIDLDHLTVLPQAMARLYCEVSGSVHPAAVALMLPGAPVIGVFQAGDVRFIAEPPPALEALIDDDIQTVIDQVGRARIHLRHHFRGADIDRVYVAADPADRPHVHAVLDAALNTEIAQLAPTMGPPAAIAALGGVMNAEMGTEMTFFPSAEHLQRLGKERRVRAQTVVAIVVCVAAIAFAAFNTIAASLSARELQTQRAAAEAQMSRTSAALGVIEERRANLERIAGMEAQRIERQLLARILNGIRLAQPPNVGITAATVSRTDAGWSVAVTGKAIGSSGAQVLRGVDSFYRELPRRIPIQSLSLDSFDYASGDGVAGDFTMSFVAGAAAVR